MFALFGFCAAFLIFAAFSYLGCWLSAQHPKLGRCLLSAVVALGAICGGFAYLSTLYPGPDSRYLDGNHEALIRAWITAPTQYLWLLLLALAITTVAYFLERLLTEKSAGNCLAVTLLNLICAVLYLPVIFFGFAMHVAYVAGVWL